ncbi:MAG TPA: protease modulator HflK [Verrucomicrobiae bacterium]|nr:protease modulator HflK [Verrucomicrobiae bacterium]
MSDPHHPHPHPHSEEDHAGDQAQAALNSGGSGSPTPPDESFEDAGSQALADALRSSFAIVKVLMGVLVVVFLLSGFFKVEPQEKAVILRFGRPVDNARLLESGAHWAFPPPIDEIVRIPIGQIHTVNSSVGWFPVNALGEPLEAEPLPGQGLAPVRDGYLLSGDGNILHLAATLRYRIAEPGLRYLLDFANASNLVMNAFNNALIYAAARYSVDDILTRDQAGFRETTRARLEELVERHDLGIMVEQIDNLRVLPPRQLKFAFDQVLEAEVRRSKEINDARTYENQTLSQARAEAEARKNTAATERTRLVEFVAAEVERFTNNLPAFRTNRELFQQQRKAEVFANVFANAKETIVAPQRGPGGSRTILLQIDRDPPKPKAPEAPKAADHH